MSPWKYFRHIFSPSVLLPVPPGYTIVYPPKTDLSWKQPGYISPSRKLIVIRRPKGSWGAIHTLNHELGHAWGVPGCSRPWCLMWEIETWKKSWKDKLWEKLAAPFQFLYGLRPCPKCHQTILNNMNNNNNKENKDNE